LRVRELFAPSDVSLQLATDPDEASGLSYEEEEALILEATEQLGMELRVEKSGCVVELKSFWQRFIDRCGNISARKIADYSSRGAI
jgi:hypothetical protein